MSARPTNPAVSVVMPVRNGGATVAAAVSSLRSQTCADFELIAIDDHSTDETRAILEQLAAIDGRIVVLRASGDGITAALNQGIAAARGRYIARQDADDLSLPSRFARQVEQLDSHQHVCAVGTAATAIDDEGRAVGPLPFRTGAAAVREGIRSVRATPVHGAMMMRTECLRAVGGYREAFRSCQDFDLWLRLLERWEIDNVPEVLYQWRLSTTSAYGARRVQQLMFGGIAQAFAEERRRCGADSYAQLAASGGDLDAFAEGYRLADVLYASWGNLLLRGTREVRLAHRYLTAAIRRGHRSPVTFGLWVWTALGFRWPGSRPLTATSSDRQPPEPRSS